MMLLLALLGCTCAPDATTAQPSPAAPLPEGPAVLLLDRPTPLKGISAARHHQAPSVRLIPGTEDAWVAWRRGPNRPEIVLGRLDAAMALTVGPTPISPRDAGDGSPHLRLIRGAPSVTWSHQDVLYEASLSASGEPKTAPRRLGEAAEGAAVRLSERDLFWMQRGTDALHLHWHRGGSEPKHLRLDGATQPGVLLSQRGTWVGWLPTHQPGQLHLARIRGGELQASTLVTIPPRAQDVQLAETPDAWALVHRSPAEVRCLGPHGSPRGMPVPLAPEPSAIAVAAHGHTAVIATLVDDRLLLHGVDLRSCTPTGAPLDPTDGVVGHLAHPSVDLTLGEGGLDGIVAWEHRHTPYTAPNIGGRRFAMPTP